MTTTRYTREHEWVRTDGNIATVGITDYAQGQLGDVVFVELPEIGRMLGQHEAMAVVESVKAASDVYAPIGGEVLEVNEALAAEPALVNRSPEQDGWFCRLRIAQAGELDALMDAPAYQTFIQSLA
jgi:glycine cleavage system H protein